MNDIVIHDRRGSAFWITLNRPNKRNAINDKMIEGVIEGIAKAEADSEIRCIVLTGAGEKAFCAGGDLQPDGGFNFDNAHPRLPYGNLMRRAHDCSLPILVVVNGVCVAGGMGLLALGDIAISVDTAKFGLPEAKIGLFPMQVLALMKILVPPRILREWLLTGEIFLAEDAKNAGLLNRVVHREQLDDAVAAMIAKLTQTSPTAIRRGKYALRAVEQMTFDQAIAFAEGQIGLMMMTEDAREGLVSFNEKRPPKFTGR